MDKLSLIKELINNEQYYEAIDIIADNEKDYFDKEEYWILRGIACLQIGAYELSEDSFLKALEMNPSNSDTNYNLATLYHILECDSDAALYYGLCYRNTDDESLKAELKSMYDDNNPCKSIFECACSTIHKTYIVLSNIPWSDIQQRVHHISKSLSLFGNNVSFIEPRTNVSIENHPDIKQLALSCALEPINKINTLKIYKPLVVADDSTGKVQYDTYLDLIKSIGSEAIKSNEEVVLIAYHPDSIDVVSEYDIPCKSIYECVDDHSDNEVAYWGGKDCILKEYELMNKSDFITTTATSLFVERAILQNRENVFLSKNAVSERDFTILEEVELQDIEQIPSPRIVYSGFVYKRFDEKLFYELVKTNPDKSFIVIGPISEGLLQEEYPNLYFLGVKKHSELKDYLSKCDIGIVPHIETCDMDIACDSIKQYEFLASGLDVVTTFVPESVLNKKNIYAASDVNDFNKHIHEILNNKKDADRSITKNFISANSWNDRAALLCSLTDGKIGSNDSKNLINETRSLLSNCAKEYSNPIIQILNIMSMDCANSEKVSLVSRVFNDSNDKYIERYYIKLLLSEKEYKTAIEVASKSSWISKEVVDELNSIPHDNLQAIEVLLAICSNDFVLAKKLCSKLNSEQEQMLYSLYLELVLGASMNKEIYNKLINIELKTPISKYMSQFKKTIESQKNIYLIGDETALSRTMLPNIESAFPFGNYISIEELSLVSNKELLKSLSKSNVQIIVLGEANYVNIVRYLAKQGVDKCSIAIIVDNEIVLAEVTPNMMRSVKNEAYKKTVGLIYVDAKDSNLYAIANLIPKKYKKYTPLLIPLENLRDKRYKTLLPLITGITVSGHGSVYWHLPNYTYHIEVWHAGLSLKTCGLMDVSDKASGIGGDVSMFKRANTFCVASHLDMMIKNSWFALSEDKYKIIGQPRTDYLYITDGRKNLEKVLGVSLKDKKVILNMPTFHSFNVSGRVEGAADLNESIKIRNFDYKSFNDYLVENNMVCISKVHPREAEVVSKKMEKYEGALSNVFFLTNEDLDDNKLAIYEILNGADILITDYSSVYSDFMLLDRPTIFINSDLDEYRNTRGISLEPYDFWTAGPKLQTQEELHKELLLCANDPTYYKKERDLLMPLFHKYPDDKATERFWEMVDDIVDSIY